MVLTPIEPVAPRIVMLRMAASGSGFDRTRLVKEWPVGVMRSPYQQPARGAVPTTAQQSDQAADERGGPKAIEPIHHAAMTGNELACILGTELALDPGLQQIAELRHHRQQQSDHG